MGGGLLLIESRSLATMLVQVFPENNWDKSKFEYPSEICMDKHLANYFVEWLKTQNDKEITTVCQYVKARGEEDIITKALQAAFPSKWRFISKKSQYMLKTCIQQLFAKENTLILEDHRYPDVDHLELDYFLPEYKLAFEYQVCLPSLIVVLTRCVSRGNSTIELYLEYIIVKKQ